MKSSKIIKTLSAILMLLATSVSFAQDFEEDVVDNVAPIDTHIWVLILVGLGYVLYKYRKLRSFKL
jgi:glucose uptake protein GlcU